MSALSFLSTAAVKRLADGCIAIFALLMLCLIASAGGIPLLDTIIGSRMEHSSNSPYHTDKQVYRPGDTVAYFINRKTEFTGLVKVSWTLLRIDGAQERIAGGNIDRVFKPGRYEIVSRIPLPATLADGLYQFVFSSEVTYRSYSREHPTETLPFRVKSGAEQPETKTL